jgi:tetratricopeptide (TPR) repeat protein
MGDLAPNLLQWEPGHLPVVGLLEAMVARYTVRAEPRLGNRAALAHVQCARTSFRQGSETMIERIQSWLSHGMQWIGMSPPPWLAATGLALLGLALLVSLAALRRLRHRRAPRSAAGAAATSTRPPVDMTPGSASAWERDPQGQPTPRGSQSSTAPFRAQPSEPASSAGMSLESAFAVLGGEMPAPSFTSAGAVAVAERPPTTASSRGAAAEETYRQAHALLVQPGGDAETLRSAVALLERVQEVWTREAAPERWAALQNDIGSAYQGMPTGDRAEHLRSAIVHHESALEVFDPVRHAMSWAWTQSALAAAYQSLPTGSVISNARAAVAYHQRALDVFTPENAPLEWAWNQNNLGAAYELMRNVSDSDRLRALQDAATCYSEALRVYTPARDPVLHQIVTQNLQRVQAELAAIE